MMKKIEKYICEHCSCEYESQDGAKNCQKECYKELQARLKKDRAREERLEKSRSCNHEWIYVPSTQTELRDSGYPSIEHVVGITRQCKLCYLEQTKSYENLSITEETWNSIPGDVYVSDTLVHWGRLSLGVEEKIRCGK